MIVQRRSIASGKVRSMDLPITEEQLAAYEGGELIQRAMPQLSPSEREFILTGMTDEEWDEMCAEPDEDHNPDLEDEGPLDHAGGERR